VGKPQIIIDGLKQVDDIKQEIEESEKVSIIEHLKFVCRLIFLIPILIIGAGYYLAFGIILNLDNVINWIKNQLKKLRNI
jgi:hypothetical protein